MACRDEERQHGKKRPAEGDPDATLPLAKKFGRLHLNNGHSTLDAHREGRHSSAGPSAGHGDDAMMLDDTKTTTYIHNLDQELAEADASEDGLVFLPALTAKMMSFPGSVLSTSNSNSFGKELVLYTEPSSLTVPREQDSVRKAIVESRARARAERMSSLDHPSSLDTCSGDLMDVD